jgi:hypothetical protein
MFYIQTLFFCSAAFLTIITLYSAYAQSQQEGTSSDKAGNVILANVHTMPSVVIANSGTFRINATVINNSSNTIQFSEICRPSLSVRFDKNSMVQPNDVLEFCNAISLRQLKTGETTSVVSTSYKAYAPGDVNSEVIFYYRIIHNGKVLESNDRETLKVGPIPFRFTIQ